MATRFECLSMEHEIKSSLVLCATATALFVSFSAASKKVYQVKLIVFALIGMMIQRVSCEGREWVGAAHSSCNKATRKWSPRQVNCNKPKTANVDVSACECLAWVPLCVC